MRKISSYDINLINDRFTNSAISAYTGQTAFFLMLSFFPFLLFFFSIINLTPLREADIITWAGTFMPESFYSMIKPFIQDLYANSGGRIPIVVVKHFCNTCG